MVQTWIIKLFPDRPFVFDGYYSWLISPRGYPMQMDIFVYGKQPHFCIEVDGKQHEERQFFQTKQEFNYLQTCDKLKSRLLKQKGILLFKVPYTCKTIDEFKEIIKEVL